MPHPLRTHSVHLRVMASVTASLFWAVPVGVLVTLVRLAGWATGPHLFAAGALGAWGATRSGTGVTAARVVQTALVGVAVLASLRPWAPGDWAWAAGALLSTGWVTSETVLGRVSWRHALDRKKAAS